MRGKKPEFNCPPRTVLFTDQAAAICLKTYYRIGDLVPDKFAMICNLELPPNDIQQLIQQLLSTIEFDHFAFFVSQDISAYNESVKVIQDFDEYDICAVYGFFGGTNVTVLPPIICNVYNNFHFIEAIPDTIPIQFGISEDYPYDEVASIFQGVFSQFGSRSISLYSVGSVSERISKIIHDKQEGNPISAAVFIDRAMFPGSLFRETNSYLDQAWKVDPSAVLNDPSIIASEFAGGIHNVESTLVNDAKLSPGSFNFHSFSRGISQMSKTDRYVLYATHPSIRAYLDGVVTQELLKFQKEIAEGEDVDSFIDAVSFRDAIKLIGYTSTIKPIDAESLISQVVGTRDPEELPPNAYNLASAIITKTQEYASNRSKMANILIDAIDPSKPVENMVKPPSTGGFRSFFGRSPNSSTLKEFKRVFLVVLGGISFHEAEEILDLAKRRLRNHEIILLTDLRFPKENCMGL